MDQYRINQHPILTAYHGPKIKFTFEQHELSARSGEVISSALFAHNIHCFGTHPKDHAPQGIFCANGQCAQCLVLANGKPVKACITPVTSGMLVQRLATIPELPADDAPVVIQQLPQTECDVLIVGAGPAGLTAAIELAQHQLNIIITDDKADPGGKLSLQTHNFFGSTKDCYAGTRGIDIGKKLAQQIAELPNVQLWTNSPVVGVFSDHQVGIVKDGIYYLIKPKVLLVATGARERNLVFPGCDLPGIYGAGAFQTLVNRDMIKAARRLFIIGGGNVGLIAAYHALQAGIEVVGLAEALPQCGGYKVHLDKIKRLGVPVYLSHSIIKAKGTEHLEYITISQVDGSFKPIAGSEQTFALDTLLIAVGLSPVNELLLKARQYNMKVYGAGDADVVAEASAAMFSGRIVASQILEEFGIKVEIPKQWYQMKQILGARPGETYPLASSPSQGMYVNIFCVQEIPCNPCIDVCPTNSISIADGSLMGLPQFEGKCVGCGRCVAICPGLAITMVNRNHDASGEKALVTIAWEMSDELLKINDQVITVKFQGEIVGTGKIVAIKNAKWQDKRKLLQIEVPAVQADFVAGIRFPGLKSPESISNIDSLPEPELIICRCQRISKQDILQVINKGARDINEIKASLSCCMGPCGGKTCEELILSMFKQQGIDPGKITRHVIRPFTQEVPLKAFLGED